MSEIKTTNERKKMKDKTHFFESGEGYGFESLKEKLDYFFGYFARVAKENEL